MLWPCRKKLSGSTLALMAWSRARFCRPIRGLPVGEVEIAIVHISAAGEGAHRGIKRTDIGETAWSGGRALQAV